MCPIKTSDFFDNTLNKELRDIDIVRNLSEDSFATESSILYAIYTSKYKIEFCFKENRKLYYIMIEEISEQGDNKNIALEYIDDLHLFDMKREELETFLGQPITHNILRKNHIELYLSEERIDSLYYFDISSV
mgnify:FL=1|jgi:hypothetical protein